MKNFEEFFKGVSMQELMTSVILSNNKKELDAGISAAKQLRKILPEAYRDT